MFARNFGQVVAARRRTDRSPGAPVRAPEALRFASACGLLHRDLRVWHRRLGSPLQRGNGQIEAARDQFVTDDDLRRVGQRLINLV